MFCIMRRDKISCTRYYIMAIGIHLVCSDRSWATSEDVLEQLSSANGGETIFLVEGHYGSLRIEGFSFTRPVSIKSEEPQGAKFESISIDSSSLIRIDGVHVDNGTNGSAASSLVSITSSKNIEVVNSEINGLVDEIYNGHFGITTKRSADILIENNYIHDVK